MIAAIELECEDLIQRESENFPDPSNINVNLESEMLKGFYEALQNFVSVDISIKDLIQDDQDQNRMKPRQDSIISDLTPGNSTDSNTNGQVYQGAEATHLTPEKKTVLQASRISPSSQIRRRIQAHNDPIARM